MGSLMVGLGRGGAGGGAADLDKVVDVPVFVVALDTVEVPQLQFVKGLESRASVTCLLGVGAGCCGALRSRQGRRRRACWALEQGVLWSSSLVSRASMMCLRAIEQGVGARRRSHLLANAHGLHRGVSAVAVLGKVLTCPLLLRQVRMVPDVLKTFGGAADAVLLWGFMAVCMAMRRLMFFRGFFHLFSRSTGLSRILAPVGCTIHRTLSI